MSGTERFQSIEDIDNAPIEDQKKRKRKKTKKKKKRRRTEEKKPMSFAQMDVKKLPTPWDFVRQMRSSNNLLDWFDDVLREKKFQERYPLPTLPVNGAEDGIIEGERKFVDDIDSLVYTSHEGPDSFADGSSTSECCEESIVFKLTSGKLVTIKFHFRIVVAGHSGGSEGLEEEFTQKNIDDADSDVYNYFNVDDKELARFVWKYIQKHSNYS